MDETPENGSWASRDIAVLDVLEVAVRNLDATWRAAAELVGRRAGQRRFADVARPLQYRLRGCELEALLGDLRLLRSVLEREP